MYVSTFVCSFVSTLYVLPLMQVFVRDIVVAKIIGTFWRNQATEGIHRPGVNKLDLLYKEYSNRKRERWNIIISFLFLEQENTFMSPHY